MPQPGIKSTAFHLSHPHLISYYTTHSNIFITYLTLNAPIATKVVCFSRLLKCLIMANSVDPDQTAPIGAVCSGSTRFASIFNSKVMLGNYLQQVTSADDIFRCIFFCALRVNGVQAPVVTSQSRISPLPFYKMTV